MFKALRDGVVAEVRKHIAEGDCPTRRSYNIETLEDVIADLSSPAAPLDDQELEDLFVDAMDRVHDMDTNIGDFARACVKALRGRTATPSAPTAERLRSALDGFVDALTSGGNNLPTILSINHDVLRACIDEARAALSNAGEGSDQPQRGEGGE